MHCVDLVSGDFSETKTQWRDSRFANHKDHNPDHNQLTCRSRPEISEARCATLELFPANVMTPFRVSAPLTSQSRSYLASQRAYVPRKLSRLSWPYSSALLNAR